MNVLYMWFMGNNPNYEYTKVLETSDKQVINSYECVYVVKENC